MFFEDVSIDKYYVIWMVNQLFVYGIYCVVTVLINYLIT